MPRTRRTKVASQGARVVLTPEEIPTSTSNLSAPSKADSMAPLKKARGRPPKTKPTQSDKHVKSSTEAPARKRSVRGRRRPKSNNSYNDDIDDQEEEQQISALDALRARLSAGASALRGKTSSPPRSRQESLHSSGGLHEDTRRRIASTPRILPPSVARSRTPSVQQNTDDDLYGLSPRGKASQANIASRRASAQHAPPSVVRVHGTPAMDASVLALANFKRRPRQPSIIRMVQQGSEIGREHEEALLGAELDQTLDDTLRDFDDFLPEDESTPLNFGKKHGVEATNRDNIGSEDEPRTSSSRKRKRSPLEDNEVQIPGSSPYASSPPPIQGTTWARHAQSTRPSADEIVLSTNQEELLYAEPVSQSDTLAPPASSSPATSPKKQKSTRTSARTSELPKATSKAKTKAPKISTAHLESLLPKPRSKTGARLGRKQTTYEVLSDDGMDTTFDLPEEEDELSRPAARRRATSRAQASPLTKKKNANRAVGKDSNVGSNIKGKQKRTYGKRQEIDQENEVLSLSENDEDDTIEIDVNETAARKQVGPSKELERARQKFAAVDDWDMEFEIADLGGGESSPWR